MHARVFVCTASDAKSYLLDVGQKVDILDVKLDLVGTFLDVVSDDLTLEENKTTDVWEQLVQTWQGKKEGVGDSVNTTGNARGYATITTITKADAWDNLVSKLGYVKNTTHEAFDDVVTLAENVLEWKWNKTAGIFGAIADFVHHKKKDKATCPDDVAFEIAMSPVQNSLFSLFADFIQSKDFVVELKESAKGKAILVPDTQTMYALFDIMGLFWQSSLPNNGSSFLLPSVTISPYLRNVFTEWMKQSLIVSRTEFENLLGNQFKSCYYAAGVSIRDVLSVTSVRLTNITKGVYVYPDFCGTKFFTYDPQTASSRAQARAGRTAEAVDNGGIGYGYNVLLGNPEFNTQISRDPGWASSLIFDEAANKVSTDQRNFQCTQYERARITTSEKENQEKLNSDFGIGLGYGPVSFTGSYGSGSSKDSSTNSEKVRIISGSEVISSVRRYREPIPLRVLCNSFIRIIELLMNAKDDEANFDRLMEDYLNAYGTHFVNQVTVGGIANTIITTDAQTVARLQEDNVNIEFGVQFAYNAFKVDGPKETITNSVVKKTIETLKTADKTTSTVPADIAPDFSGLGKPDGAPNCAAYAEKIRAEDARAETLAVIDFKLEDNAKLLTTPELWTNVSWYTPKKGEELAKKITEYILKCKNDGSCVASDACAKGYFKSGSKCENCYSGGNKCDDTETCDPLTGACISPEPEKTWIWDSDRTLQLGEYLISRDGKCKLEFQSSDGNLVRLKKNSDGNFQPYGDGSPTNIGMSGQGGTLLKFTNTDLQGQFKKRPNLKLEGLPAEREVCSSTGVVVGAGFTGKKCYFVTTSIRWTTRAGKGPNTAYIPADHKQYGELQDDCNFVIYVQPPVGERYAVWDWSDLLNNQGRCIPHENKNEETCNDY